MVLEIPLSYFPFLLYFIINIPSCALTYVDNTSYPIDIQSNNKVPAYLPIKGNFINQ